MGHSEGKLHSNHRVYIKFNIFVLSNSWNFFTKILHFFEFSTFVNHRIACCKLIISLFPHSPIQVARKNLKLSITPEKKCAHLIQSYSVWKSIRSPNTHPSRRDVVHLLRQSVFIYLIPNSLQLQTAVRKVALGTGQRRRAVRERNFWFLAQIEGMVGGTVIVLLREVLRYILTRCLRNCYVWDGGNVVRGRGRGGRRRRPVVGQIARLGRQGCTGRRGRLAGRRRGVVLERVQCEILEYFTWKKNEHH